MNLKQKKLAALLAVTYLVSYATRINYAAVLVEIGRAEGFSKSSLSLALAASFISYGIGQTVSGYFGDRIQPKRLVFCGLLVTTAMNLAVPLCGSALQMSLFWCVNGLAQSFLRPPLTKLSAAFYSHDDYQKVALMISWGSSIGTILVYLVSPLVISVSRWQTVFFLSAACGAVMAAVWFRLCPEIPADARKEDSARRASEKPLRVLFLPGVALLMLANVFQGALREGVTAWMPTYLSETYSVSSVISILSGTVMPLFTMLSFQIAYYIYRKKIRSVPLCGGVFFAAGTAFASLLLILSGKSIAGSVLSSALFTGAMYGVAYVMVDVLPIYFERFGNVAFISGVMNTCTYLGSAVSSYGIARVSEQIGWTGTAVIWVLIAAAGTALCFLAVPLWKRSVRENA